MKHNGKAVRSITARMETTRHFVATVYVVHDGATVLHEHDRLGLWLPPGGHIDRDELPHEAALREAHEETGLDVTLVQEPAGVESPTARPLPKPAHLLLEDITVHDGAVSHQHVDFIYFAEATDRRVRPQGDDEVDADSWEWVTAETLQDDGRFDPDVIAHGIEAIETVAQR